MCHGCVCEKIYIIIDSCSDLSPCHLDILECIALLLAFTYLFIPFYVITLYYIYICYITNTLIVIYTYCVSSE